MRAVRWAAPPGPLGERRGRPEDAHADGEQGHHDGGGAHPGPSPAPHEPEQAGGDHERGHHRVVGPATQPGIGEEHDQSRAEHGGREPGHQTEVLRRHPAVEDTCGEDQRSAQGRDQEQRHQERLGAAHDVVAGAQPDGVHVDPEVAELRARQDVAVVEEHRGQEGRGSHEVRADRVPALPGPVLLGALRRTSTRSRQTGAPTSTGAWTSEVVLLRRGDLDRQHGRLRDEAVLELVAGGPVRRSTPSRWTMND